MNALIAPMSALIALMNALTTPHERFNSTFSLIKMSRAKLV